MKYPDGEENLRGVDQIYYRGMKNGMTDLILSARDSDQPLTFDLLENIAENALSAVMEYMTGGAETCVVCGAPIPEGRQVCYKCSGGYHE